MNDPVVNDPVVNDPVVNDPVVNDVVMGEASDSGTTTWSRALTAVTNGADALDEARALVAAMTDAERRWCLDGDMPLVAGGMSLRDGGYHKRPFPSGGIDRLGIPPWRFSDGPRGCVIGPATAFPVSVARGATWDPDLEERIGEAIGAELRVVGADLYGGVCVNVLRHPQWGRAQETYGEDPYHVGEMGAALTRGAQRHVMACVKHFAANSMENARFEVDVTVDDATLHEIFLPHFRRIVDEGVAVVMSAYNSVNGTWCGENRDLLTGVLRDEWGFTGFVISDWIFGLRNGPASVGAGLDVEMPFRLLRAFTLVDAVEEGALDATDIARSAERILATRLRFAAEHADLDCVEGDAALLATAEHRLLARETAAKSAVLLRNELVDGSAVLPIERATTGSVAVIGTLAVERNLGDGGSSDVMAPEVVTMLDGIREAAGDARVSFDDGTDTGAAASAAAAAALAVVVVGYTRDDEGEYLGNDRRPRMRNMILGDDEPDAVARFEASMADEVAWEFPVADDSSAFATGGDRRSLALKPHDVELIRAVGAANPRTVLLVVSGSTVVVEDWIESVGAYVQAWYSGMEGGRGIADVLFGDTEPSGRLPFTVPSNESDLPAFDPDADAVVYDAWHGWWLLERDAVTPRYPFGFGLAYTTFGLDDVHVDSAGSTLVVTGSVTNTGSRDGVDLIQVYARGASDERRRLVGFTRVSVDAGRMSEFEIRIDSDHLTRRDSATRSWVLRDRSFEITVARHAGDTAAETRSVDIDAT